MDELGHFSVRVPDKDLVLINGKISPGQAVEEDIILLDLEGNKLDLSLWIAKKLAQSTSLSFRLNGLDWGNIDGADTKLLPMPTVPTKDPNLRGGTRIDALVGINFVTPGLTSLRLAAEAGAPVYQDLDGPQLETDLVFTLGAQFTF